MDGDPVADAAVVYAAHGWPIFPLAGKVPINASGHRGASTDAEQVASWWRANPTANIGWAIPAGWWALDVDPRHGGGETLRALERQHEPLPSLTLRQTTGGGGQHWIFRTPDGATIRQGSSVVGEGLDTRVGGRGYLVIAPSVHPETGRAYRWLAGVEPVEAPTWLLDLVRAPKAPERPATPYVPPTSVAGLTRRERYARAALRGEAQAVAEAGEGERNSRLNRAWFRCAQFRDALDRAEVEGELTRAALACGLAELEIRKVLR